MPPTLHPDYFRYCQMMTGAGFDAERADIGWQLLVGGLKEQKLINRKIDAMGLTGAEARRTARYQYVVSEFWRTIQG
ncbi:hypothetical protein [Streptomyces flaveolus]|uniref:hypothetical protein n=1 Tax=Streptomyces flaveolus TaxID=67297 RepID=UPI0033EAF95C